MAGSVDWRDWVMDFDLGNSRVRTRLQATDHGIDIIGGLERPLIPSFCLGELFSDHLVEKHHSFTATIKFNFTFICK